MKWQDVGLILKVSKYGDRDCLVVLFTQQHGKHSGLVRGGASKRNMNWMQPGTQVQVGWQARLEDHLGAFKLEPCATCFAQLAQNNLSLACLVSLRDLLLKVLADRQPQTKLFQATCVLLLSMQQHSPLVWLTQYVRWELLLLRQSGYAPNLTATFDNDKKVQRNLKSCSTLDDNYQDQKKYLSSLAEGAFLLQQNDSAINNRKVYDLLNFFSYYLEEKMNVHMLSRDIFLRALSDKHLLE